MTHPVESLRSIPFFTTCTSEELADVASSLDTVAIPGGSTIFRERDPGNDMYIISEGTVRILTETNPPQTIAELRAGDFFGEMALITGLPRSATAIAVTDVRLWRLEKERFDLLIRSVPVLSVEMVRVLARRARRQAPANRDLRGRTALVTGASKGLGTFIARALAREGMNVVLTARSAEALEGVRREVEALGVRAVAIPGDVGNHADMQTLVVKAISELGSIDVIVNNAGMLLTLAYNKVYAQEIDALVRTNLTGPMFLSWLVLPAMLERGFGHIVNIGSLAGKYGPAYNELYSSTKAGLIAFTQSIRASYRDSGVSASAVCPGFIETGMYARSRRHGLRAPRLLGSVTPDTVAEGVVRAVKKDLPELILNPGPIRFMLALPTLMPTVAEWARRRMGTDELYRKAAEIRAQRRTDTGQ